MQNTYETIETLGLTEVGASLPIPSDRVLTGRCIGESFEALFGPLVSTGLEGEIEPIAHGLVTVLFRRREALSNALDKETRTLGGLIRCTDGSEVLETQLEQSQDNIARLKSVLDAIDQMAKAAASAYELQTSKAYIPPSGSRITSQAHLTAGVFEARRCWKHRKKNRPSGLKSMHAWPLSLPEIGTGLIITRSSTSLIRSAPTLVPNTARRFASIPRRTKKALMQ